MRSGLGGVKKREEGGVKKREEGGVRKREEGGVTMCLWSVRPAEHEDWETASDAAEAPPRLSLGGTGGTAPPGSDCSELQLDLRAPWARLCRGGGRGLRGLGPSDAVEPMDSWESRRGG